MANLGFFEELSIPQGTKATARACVFTPLHDSAGFGAFVILPLVAVKQEGSPDAAVGMRYSTPTSAVGYIAKPLKQQLSQFWGVSLLPSGPTLNAQTQDELQGGRLNRLHVVPLLQGGPQIFNDGWVCALHRRQCTARGTHSHSCSLWRVASIRN